MLDFIVNVKAGSGKALAQKSKIEKLLILRGIKHRFHETTAPKNAVELTKKLCENGATDVIAVGGDGTANEVLNGLNVGETNFGIIPCGSGNDFAATVGIPKNTEKALDIILSGKTKPTDFFVCDGVRGLNAVGTGIDVDILERTAKNKVLKGKIKYFASLIVSLMKFDFCEFKLKKCGDFAKNDLCDGALNSNELSGERNAPSILNAAATDACKSGDNGGNVSDNSDKRSALIACCGNGTRIGGGIPVCPEALTDDGKLDFIIVNAMKRSRIPGALIKLMRGKILSLKECEFKRIDEVILNFDKKPPVQIDGEIYYDLDFNVHVEKGKLKLFRP